MIEYPCAPFSPTQHTFTSLPVRAHPKSCLVTVSSSEAMISQWCAVSSLGSDVAVKTSWPSNLGGKRTSYPSCSHPHIQYSVVEQGQGNLRTDTHLGKEKHIRPRTAMILEVMGSQAFWRPPTLMVGYFFDWAQILLSYPWFLAPGSIYGPHFSFAFMYISCGPHLKKVLGGMPSLGTA